MKHLGFPKDRRLASNHQFRAVLDHNRRTSNALLTLFVAANDCGHPRLGVSVGRACGSAVVRNRLKRLIREAFRQSQDRLPQGYDYVLMASPSLSRKLRRPGQGRKTLAALTCGRVQASLLSLAETIVEEPCRGDDGAASQKEQERK